MPAAQAEARSDALTMGDAGRSIRSHRNSKSPLVRQVLSEASDIDAAQSSCEPAPCPAARSGRGKAHTATGQKPLQEHS
jgi:hypothetical protein